MFFDKNLNMLQLAGTVSSNFARQLNATAPAEGVEIYETEAGDYSLKYKGIFLHDLNGAQAEAREVVANNSQPHSDRQYIIFGIGMGYVLDELFNNSNGGWIFIYEPNLPLLRFVLENVDLTKYFRSCRVCICTNDIEMREMFRPKMLFGDKVDVLVTRGYAALMAEEITSVMQDLVTLTDDRGMDYCTIRYFHYTWIKQFFDNVCHIPATRSLDDLQDKFAGKPAIVVSRGPSLDAAIEDLRKLAGSVVIISVGSAMRRLWQAGITPDFAVFYDANGVKEQLHGIPEEFINKVSFLMSPFTQSLAFTAPSRDHFMFMGQNNKEYAEWLDLVYNRKHARVEGGGTVSLVAFQAAKLMQCNPIVLVGQDLAFPKDQVYAGGIELKVNEHGQMALEKTEELYAGPEAMATVMGQNGEEMKTLKAYLSFIRHFEVLAVYNERDEKPRTLINASIGGANISGFNLMSLADFHENYRPESWKVGDGHALDYVDAMPCLDVKERTRQMKKAVNRLLEGVQKSIRLARELTRKVGEQIGPDPELEKMPDLLAPVSRTQQRLTQFVEAYPMVRYFMMLETIKFTRRYQRTLDDPQSCLTNLRSTLHYLANCHDLLVLCVLPHMERALKRLNGETVDDATAESKKEDLLVEEVTKVHGEAIDPLLGTAASPDDQPENAPSENTMVFEAVGEPTPLPELPESAAV